MSDLFSVMASGGTSAGDANAGFAEGDIRRSAAPGDYAPQTAPETGEPQREQQYTEKLSRLSPCPWLKRIEVSSDDDEELDASIKLYGVFQPLLVTMLEGELVVIAGMRRYYSALRAGLERVPVRLLEISRQEARAITLLENTARKNLTPWEEMIGVRALLETNWELTVRELSALTGWSQGKAHSRLLLARGIGLRVIEYSQVSQDKLCRLSLHSLELIAREPEISAKVFMLVNTVAALPPILCTDTPVTAELDSATSLLAEECGSVPDPTVTSVDVISGEMRRLRSRNQHASSFRMADRGKRCVLGASPKLVTRATAPEVVEDIARFVEAVGRSLSPLAGVIRAWGQTNVPG